MLRRHLCSVLLVMALLATASARMTEITFNRYNQTSPFSATQIFTPPTYNGNYHMGVYLNANCSANEQNGVPGITITALLHWTDDLGIKSTATVALLNTNGGAAVAGSPGENGGWNHPIRVAANTAVTVEVDFDNPAGQSCTYNLAVSGTGFW